MPKNIHTPRDELLCEKMDKALFRAKVHGDAELVDLLCDILKDADRMEAKLFARKVEVESLQTAIATKTITAIVKRKCKGCSRDISHKHPNAKFHSASCKDDYWNLHNPRGIALEREKEREQDYLMGSLEEGWDGHKVWR